MNRTKGPADPSRQKLDVSKPVTVLLVLKRVDCNDGVAAYMQSLISGLKEAGDRVVIVSGEVTTLYGSEARKAAIARDSVDWIVLEGFERGLPRLEHLRRIADVMRRYHVDVISPQGFSVLPVSRVLSLFLHTPVVANFHLIPNDVGSLSLKQRIGYRLVCAVFGAQRYLAISTDVEEFFRNQCGIAQHRIQKQLMGVDTAFFRPATREERAQARDRFGIRDEMPIAILPARLNSSKGHDIVGAAFRLLRERRPELQALCLFAGDGDEREAIERAVLIDDADRKSLRFLGFVDRTTLRDAYWSADIVLLPSRIEGFGLVVAEAMCCGAIAIRTPAAGWRDQVIEGETGLIIPFDDPRALAIAIENIVDSSRRAEMREQAMRMAAERFARTRMIEGISSLYRRVGAS